MRKGYYWAYLPILSPPRPAPLLFYTETPDNLIFLSWSQTRKSSATMRLTVRLGGMDVILIFIIQTRVFY